MLTQLVHPQFMHDPRTLLRFSEIGRLYHTSVTTDVVGGETRVRDASYFWTGRLQIATGDTVSGTFTEHRTPASSYVATQLFATCEYVEANEWDVLVVGTDEYNIRGVDQGEGVTRLALEVISHG